jgi:acetyl-CoA carboxylase alpha subunit
MGVTKDPRKEKIRELKQVIELASADLKAAQILLRTISEEKPETAEDKADQTNRVKEQLKLISQKAAILSGLGEELVQTRMNKHNSSSFSWTPSPPNRRMRRAAARNR